MTARVKRTLRHTIKEAEILLCHPLSYSIWPSQLSERYWGEIATDAVRVEICPVSRTKISRQTSKWSDTKTSTPRAVWYIPWWVDYQARFGVGEIPRDKSSVPAKSVNIVKYGRIEEDRGIVISTWRVKCPIPVRNSALPAARLKLLLVYMNKKTMIGIEHTLEQSAAELHQTENQYLPQNARYQR